MIFQNKIANTFFSFEGKISSREYRAMLILILTFVSLKLLAPVITGFAHILSRDLDFVEDTYSFFNTQTYFYNAYSIVNLLINFVVLYCSFAITIKRCRAKSLPIAVGWILGALTFLVLYAAQVYYSSQILSSLVTSRTIIEGELMPAINQFLFLALIIIGIGIVIFLSRSADYDFETYDEDYEDSFYDYGLRPITYILKIFNLEVIVGICYTIFVIIQLNTPDARWSRNAPSSPLITILYYIVTITYIILAISYLLKRARSAGVKKRWVGGIILTFFVLLACYLFTGLAILHILAELVILSRYVLIALPHKKVILDEE